MPSVYDLMDGTRARLGRVRSQHPSEDDVLREVSSHLRNFLNLLNNTGLTWDYRTLTLTVDPEIDTYQIPDQSFGKAYAVLTRDDANPNHIVRKVAFFEPPNLNFDWGWPNNVGMYLWNYYDGSLHTAVRCAFFWRDSLPYIQFKPIPQLSCDYDISFSVGDWTRTMSLDSEPVLGQHHDLIQVRAARSLLSLSEWYDSEDMNDRKRKNLAMSLTADEQLYERQFLATALTKNAGSGITQRWAP